MNSVLIVLSCVSCRGEAWRPRNGTSVVAVMPVNPLGSEPFSVIAMADHEMQGTVYTVVCGVHTGVHVLRCWSDVKAPAAVRAPSPCDLRVLRLTVALRAGACGCATTSLWCGIHVIIRGHGVCGAAIRRHLLPRTVCSTCCIGYLPSRCDLSTRHGKCSTHSTTIIVPACKPPNRVVTLVGAGSASPHSRRSRR